VGSWCDSCVGGTEPTGEELGDGPNQGENGGNDNVECDGGKIAREGVGAEAPAKESDGQDYVDEGDEDCGGVEAQEGDAPGFGFDWARRLLRAPVCGRWWWRLHVALDRVAVGLRVLDKMVCRRMLLRWLWTVVGVCLLLLDGGGSLRVRVKVILMSCR
jgi:hypothetical protein